MTTKKKLSRLLLIAIMAAAPVLLISAIGKLKKSTGLELLHQKNMLLLGNKNINHSI